MFFQPIFLLAMILNNAKSICMLWHLVGIWTPLLGSVRGSKFIPRHFKGNIYLELPCFMWDEWNSHQHLNMPAVDSSVSFTRHSSAILMGAQVPNSVSRVLQRSYFRSFHSLCSPSSCFSPPHDISPPKHTQSPCTRPNPYPWGLFVLLDLPFKLGLFFFSIEGIIEITLWLVKLF